MLRGTAASVAAPFGFSGFASAWEITPNCLYEKAFIGFDCFKVQCFANDCCVNGRTTGYTEETFDFCEEYCYNSLRTEPRSRF